MVHGVLLSKALLEPSGSEKVSKSSKPKCVLHRGTLNNPTIMYCILSEMCWESDDDDIDDDDIILFAGRSLRAMFTFKPHDGFGHLLLPKKVSYI